MEATNHRKTFLKMGKLKIRIKKLETEYKELENIVLISHFEKLTNKLGTFSTGTRENYVMDNYSVAKAMGMEEFKKQSKISKAGIEKGIGNKGFEKLLKEGGVIQTASTYYFIFNAKR